MKQWTSWAAGLIAAAALVACGGGGSDSSTAGAGSKATAAVSSGSISAFGSVFVNGHEFATGAAKVVDSDTGATLAATQMEVGMSVDVKSASDSTTSAPKADEIHLHALARGFVDDNNTSTGTLTVMGQTVALTAATNYSDQRACTTAATSACAPVSGQDSLASTGGAGAASYVTVYGYLFSASSGTAQIVATLVRVSDVPDAASSTKVPRYKAEGLVTAVGSSSITIGGLSVDLAAASCRTSAGSVPCASAFSVGQVVSAWSSTAPALPATSFAADVARQRSQLPLAADGTTVELEGRVSAVNSSANTFVLRGITVNAAGLASGTALPAVGDVVEVKGTLATAGTSLDATELKVIQAAGAVKLGLEGDFADVAAGTAADTYTFTLLGKSVTVNASTRLADRQQGGREHHGEGSSSTTSNPFNISTFATYLAASTSKHVMVRASADASGKLTALSVTLMPASTVAAIAGKVDATPAPVNSSATGTPSTFSVAGIAVSADPSRVQRPRGSAATVAAGDRVLVVGTFSGSTLTVAAATGTQATPASSNGGESGSSHGFDLNARHAGGNIVIDYGQPEKDDDNCF
jgi:hypothetical protein